MRNFSLKTRYSFLIVYLLLISPLAKSQCYNNPPLNISTNPDNYQNPEDPTELKKWDWRLAYWFGYRKETPVPLYYQINSPFYDVYNPNLFDLSALSVKNYDPKNGWELLKRDFGTPTIAPSNPYFILYNKYTGLIRIFVLINSNYQNARSAMITLRFKEGVKTAANLSQFGDKSFGLNAFKNTAKILVPNQYLNGGQGANSFFGCMLTIIHYMIHVYVSNHQCSIWSRFFFQVGM